MTVPAAEKMTIYMISTTPVLIELRVFHVFRTPDRSERAINVRFLMFRQCTYRANRAGDRKKSYINELARCISVASDPE